MAGIFSAIGSTLNIVTTIATSLDRTVTRTDKLIGNGFDSIDLIVDNAMEDFATDNIVANAKRKIRIAEANAEATTILASLAKKK